MQNVNLLNMTTAEKLVALAKAVNDIYDTPIFPNPKGEWVSNESYNKYDIVVYNNKTYWSIYDGAQSGQQPDTSPNYWVIYIEPQQGVKGDTGLPGKDGSDGKAATIQVGSVSTGEAGTNVSVSNSGTNNAAIFDFVIPRGDKGDKGDTGDDGDAATIQIGSTETVEPYQPAEVTNVGTANAAIFNFKIPKGETGSVEGIKLYRHCIRFGMKKNFPTSTIKILQANFVLYDTQEAKITQLNNLKAKIGTAHISATGYGITASSSSSAGYGILTQFTFTTTLVISVIDPTGPIREKNITFTAEEVELESLFDEVTEIL